MQQPDRAVERADLGRAFSRTRRGRRSGGLSFFAASFLQPTRSRSPLFEIALVLVRVDHVVQPRRKRAEALEAHRGRRCNTKQHGRSMKARSQRGQRETTALIERAQRVLRESRKLLEQRKMQLKELEQLLKQNPEIAHGIQ